MRQIIDGAAEALCLLDNNLTINMLNQAMADMLGFDKADCEGALCRELFAGDWCDTPDCPLNSIRNSESRVERTRRWYDKKGSVSELLLAFSPWLDEGAKLRGAVLSIRNITAEAEAKRRSRSLQQQLSQSQKLEALGRLASGVAHDFNNLLSVIINYSQFARQALADDHPVKKDVDEIHRAALQGASLTRQMLSFSRREIISPVVLDLNDVVTNMAKMLHRMVSEDIRIRIETEPNLRLVRVDAAQMEQVLLNLVVNAREAMPDGGVLTIETDNVEIDSDMAKDDAHLEVGSYVRLRVRDTGCGIAPENIDKVFEPFFTTKPVGAGTGLGLSSVYGIARQAGGSIKLDSQLGKGTCFSIFIPSHKLSKTGVKVLEPELKTTNSKYIVLVVEDEDQVRRLIRRMLEDMGHTVLSAAGASEAIKIAKTHDGPIHLLLSDVVMPEVNGRKLADDIATIRPEIKVLFMSGYSDDTVLRLGVKQDNFHSLRKPFDHGELSRALAMVLES